MKTKFSSVVKVKQKKVDEVFSKLLHINALIAAATQKSEQIAVQLHTLIKPTSGDFAFMKSFAEISNAYRGELTQNEAYKQELINQKEYLLGEHKSANLELEKMKYLEGEEIKKISSEIKRREKNMLDEMGILLHATKN